MDVIDPQVHFLKGKIILRLVAVTELSFDTMHVVAVNKSECYRVGAWVMGREMYLI